MRLTHNFAWPFDRDVPIHNWYYPLTTNEYRVAASEAAAIYGPDHTSHSVSRALYLHIPFCDTICSFCPFVRKSATDNDSIEAYFESLLQELEAKGEVNRAPLNAVFVGGGTPSLLAPDQIDRLGAALKRAYELSHLKEFSFEMEAKSVSRDKLHALRDIGVTNVRLGAQTFQEQYRSLLGLTASVAQVHQALDWMQSDFDRVSIDVLYAFDGQSERALARDVEAAIATGVPLIDLYPLNPVASQARLHKDAAILGMPPPTAQMRHTFRCLAAEMLEHAGYYPHNGHGFVRSNDAPGAGRATTDEYRFHYHDHVYGDPLFELIGVGVNALSYINGMLLQNTGVLTDYIDDVSVHGHPTVNVGVPHPYCRASRPIICGLPYFGAIKKATVDFLSVFPDTLSRLVELVEVGLIVDDGAEFRLTKHGWEWYTNCMYYLCPPADRLSLDEQVNAVRKTGRAAVDDVRLQFLQVSP